MMLSARKPRKCRRNEPDVERRDVRLFTKLRLGAAMVCLAAAVSAKADGLNAGPTDRVAFDLPKDAVVMAVGVVGATVPLIFANQLAPKSCRWCDGSLGVPVNSVDDWFHQHLTGSVVTENTATTLSSALAYAVLPAGALTATVFTTGPAATSGAGLRNAMIVAESVAVSSAITETMKLIVGRQRPYVDYQHVVAAGTVGSSLPVISSDANLSFPSGHTSVASPVGTSAAMLATLEHSPAAPWLWAGTGVLTVATGTLRMISESHYFTDVLAGAAIGASTGVLIPLLHRRGSALGDGGIPAVAAAPGGATFSVSGAF
jgi:membrane-associated phospholipid phosphatase